MPELTQNRRLKVLIWVAHNLELPHITEDYVQRVAQVFGGHDVTITHGRDSYRGKLSGVEVLVAWGFHKDILQEAADLRWIQFSSAGIDHALSDELLNSGIRMTTQVGLHAVPVAEQAVAMMLAFARGLHIALRHQSKHLWDRTPVASVMREFEGSCVGIVGMGHIGRTVAFKSRALGARIVATRSSQANADDADEWVDKKDLLPLLSQSDWVVLTAPITQKTRGTIGVDEFDAMKNGAVLVNVARGAIVDEPAMMHALESGKLGGVCLDVFHKEPLQVDSPLWDMPNVIISPHVGGATNLYGLRGAATVADNLKAYLAGEKMPTEFDRVKGY